MQKQEIKILLVDDEPDILEIVSYNLQKEGYQVYNASDGMSGLRRAKKIAPQLIISDIMMPEIDGIEMCEQIRQIPRLADILVVFLTARGEDYSMVAGFEAGADDYINKPIKPKVLVSKVKALLRRTVKDQNKVKKIKIKDLTLDNDSYKVTKKGEEINLPKKEFELLALLISKPEKVFRREEILQSVWGEEVVVGDRTIDVHIRKLRKKLGNRNFKTVKGVGYKYIAKE